jgi:TolB-like protein
MFGLTTVNGFRVESSPEASVATYGDVVHSFTVRSPDDEARVYGVRLPAYLVELVKAHADREEMPGGPRFWQALCEEVLVNDLTQSDFFNVQKETFFLPRPGDSTAAATTVKAIVTGMVQKRLGHVILEGQLIDGRTEKTINRKSYALGDPPDRRAIHEFSDDIVLWLTGERGVAGTRIAFVGDATGSKEIYLVDSDGAQVRMVTDLRSITQGRGRFTMQFDHYEDVPAHLAQALADAQKKEHE